MFYQDFLAALHAICLPRTYLEIGVNYGDSLRLSSAPAIGVDPNFHLREPVGSHVQIYRMTSDDFFSGSDPMESLPGGLLDLAFIDGAHLMEFALRDFDNVERFCAPGAVVVIDDVLPRTVLEAEREAKTLEWTGDVWKLISALRSARPDLRLIQVATSPTGLLLVLGANSGRTLSGSGRLTDLVAEYVAKQEPTEEILSRTAAVSPEDLLAAPFWSMLQAVRRNESSMSDFLLSVDEWSPRKLTPAEVEDSQRSAALGAPLTFGMRVRSMIKHVRNAIVK